ncbi:hypothetical protein [Sphaerimonospora mesophila]|uniref:hypothetical protein n=1 Tax=Sphaerimonospora mesophila TaxID=37483 RepID=UPI0006E1A66B
MRYVLTLSSVPRRRFSGEGTVRDYLATAHTEEDADLVGAMPAFEPRLNVGVPHRRSRTWREETTIDQHVAGRRAAQQVHGHLAQSDPAQSAGVLAGSPDGMGKGLLSDQLS